MAFDLDPSYKQVPERLADFREKHPEGSVQPLNPEKPYWFETIGDKTFLVYAAAAYRTPDDIRPGVGLAWEPFPGRTPYTKDSELQNAETSAWGRAIVAALASESKAVASAEDVRNRRAEEDVPRQPAQRTRRQPPQPPHDPETGELTDLPPGIEAMSLQDLTKELEAAGLPLSGNSQAKRQRLAEHRAGTPDALQAQFEGAA